MKNADPDGPFEALDAESKDLHLKEGHTFLGTGTEVRDSPTGTVEEALAIQPVIDVIYWSSYRGRAVTFNARCE